MRSSSRPKASVRNQPWHRDSQENHTHRPDEEGRDTHGHQEPAAARVPGARPRCPTDLSPELQRLWQQVLDHHDKVPDADHFALLEIDSDAPIDDLRRAIAIKILRFHPDNLPVELVALEPYATRIVARLEDARRVLLSRAERVAPLRHFASARRSAPSYPDRTLTDAERKPPVDYLATPAPRYDRAALDAPGDLPAEIKRRILDAYHGREGKNFYEFLGVDRNADRAAVRTAYFELSKTFHPDSQFRKDLGSFKGKMEAVFKHLTDAYDVLSNSKRRLLYDESLGETPPQIGLVSDSSKVHSGVRRVVYDTRPAASRTLAHREQLVPPLRAPPSNEERRAHVRARLRGRS